MEHDLVEQATLLNTRKEYNAWEQRCDKYIESLEEQSRIKCPWLSIGNHWSHISCGSRVWRNLCVEDSCMWAPDTDKWLSFDNHCRKEHVLFVVYVNLKCALEKTNGNFESATYTYHHHNVFSIGYYVHCSYDSFTVGLSVFAMIRTV